MVSLKMLFTKEQQDKIVAAIKYAEKQTSGEIKVHIEQKCPAEVDIMDRAKQVFYYLALEKTANSNGVLIYLALDDKQFVVLGDKGIDAVVGNSFWESTKNILAKYFSEGQITEGLIAGVEIAGEELKKHFPCKRGDINEISDDISYGKIN